MADIRSSSFSPSSFLSSPSTFILGDLNSHHPSWDGHSRSDSRGSELFSWIISSDLHILNSPSVATLISSSYGSLSSPDVSLGLSPSPSLSLISLRALLLRFLLLVLSFLKLTGLDSLLTSRLIFFLLTLSPLLLFLTAPSWSCASSSMRPKRTSRSSARHPKDPALPGGPRKFPT